MPLAVGQPHPRVIGVGVLQALQQVALGVARHGRVAVGVERRQHLQIAEAFLDAGVELAAHVKGHFRQELAAVGGDLRAGVVAGGQADQDGGHEGDQAQGQAQARAEA